jgi:ATP-binding cassette, subfamily B, bacterial
MKKTLFYSWEILKISWHANGWMSVLVIFSDIYQGTLYPFFQILLLAHALDLIQTNKQLEMTDFIPIAIFFIIISIIKNLLASFINMQQFAIDINLGRYLDGIIFEKLISLDPATFEKPSFQKLLTQTNSTWGVISSQIQRISGLISAIAMTITASIVLLTMFPLFIPLMLIAVIPAYYFGDRSRKKLWPFFTTKISMVNRLAYYIKDLLSLDSTSKEAAIYRTGPMLAQKALLEQKIFMRDYRNVYDPFLIKIFFSNMLQFWVFLYTQYINLTAVIRGTLGIGQFTLAFQQTLNLAQGLQGTLDMYSSMMNRMQQLDKFFDFLHFKPSIISPKHPVALPTSPTPPIIEFKNVTFKYPKTERNILRNFNLTILPGEKIAIVGENGAGKTTLIKLLLRFYDVIEGEVLVNGINIKVLSLNEWHKQIGALFQDYIQYQFTFKENVYFGDLSKKQEETLLKEALTKSGADKYVDDLPKKYDQVVGKMFDHGIDLSGGQWQKLALARAFYRNAPILILDEPTSAIDAKAEYEIFQNVQKLQKDKTVIIISHRFSTVRNADRILVLDEGKIVEEGDHETLMKKKGLYEELFTIQAKGYQ